MTTPSNIIEQLINSIEKEVAEILAEEDDRDQDLRARILIDISNVLSRIEEQEETIEVYL